MAQPIDPRAVRRAFLPLAALAVLGTFLLPTPLANSTEGVGGQGASLVQTEAFIEGAKLPSPLPVDIAAQKKMGDALSPHQAEVYAPFVELGALDSHPGEDLNVFLTRVAQAMDLFTRKTLHETCGVIMVDPARSAWRVRLTTNRSHLSCVMVEFDEPGFIRMGEDIHSHPLIPGGVHANAQDIVRRRDFACGEKIQIFDERFSSVDFEHGPGYLVSRGRLLYQHGQQWPIRQLAVFEPINEEEMPHLAKGGINPTLNPELAAAAWKNEDVDGVPLTQCPTEEADLDPAEPDHQKEHGGDSADAHE